MTSYDISTFLNTQYLGRDPHTHGGVRLESISLHCWKSMAEARTT